MSLHCICSCGRHDYFEKQMWLHHSLRYAVTEVSTAGKATTGKKSEICYLTGFPFQRAAPNFGEKNSVPTLVLVSNAYDFPRPTTIRFQQFSLHCVPSHPVFLNFSQSRRISKINLILEYAWFNAAFIALSSFTSFLPLELLRHIVKAVRGGKQILTQSCLILPIFFLRLIKLMKLLKCGKF